MLSQLHFIYDLMAPLVAAMENFTTLHLVIVGEEGEMTEAEHWLLHTHSDIQAQTRAHTQAAEFTCI